MLFFAKEALLYFEMTLLWSLKCNVLLFKKKKKLRIHCMVGCVIKANDDSVLPMYHQRFESSMSHKQEEVVIKRTPHIIC